MTFLPIVERELRLKSRRSHTYYSRCAMAAVATLMSLGIIPVSLSAGRNPAQIGQDLFPSTHPIPHSTFNFASDKHSA